MKNNLGHLVDQWAEHPTLDFRSGHELAIGRRNPATGSVLSLHTPHLRVCAHVSSLPLSLK